MPRKPKAKRSPRKAKGPRCSRCESTPVRMPGMRCPACLPTALATEAGKKKGRR